MEEQRVLSFEDILMLLKSGKEVRRTGWAEAVFIRIDCPKDMLTIPFIYMDATGPTSEDEAVKKVVFPWTPTHDDLLCSDWVIL